MIRKVQTYIETYRLLARDKPIVAGLSGGCDSASLLYILKELGYDCIAAHCNFHLRGEESNRDEDFSKDFAKTQGVEFEKIDFETDEYASRKKISIEMAARELRYNWFEELRQKYGAQAIAIAHHRDDSIETMLMNMIRGTGIRGLCGIRPKNGRIVRPLLCASREEILQFAESHNFKYVTDSTNLSDEYMRNFIRLRLLPLMEKINPSVKASLARTAENISEAETIYLQAIGQAQKALTEKNADGETEIQISKLLQFPAPKTFLYELLKKYGFSRLVSENAFNAINGESGKYFESHGARYKLLKDHDKFVIFRQKDDPNEIYVIEEEDFRNHALPIDLRMRIQTIGPSFKIDKDSTAATFDYDKVHFPLTLRHWKKGDFFVPFGMEGKQKLSDYFSCHKFSLLTKKRTWLLCERDNIIWIVGERIDNRYCVDSKTKTALIINIFQKKLQQ